MKTEQPISPPFFSVVIPLYNKENFIQNCLKSVLNQSFTNFEVIIIDDGSTDESFTKAKQIKDPRFSLYQQKNHGVSVARNKGVKKSKAAFIAFLDADDQWYPEHLAMIYSMIKNHPKQQLFATNYQIEIAPKQYRNTKFSVAVTKPTQVINNFFEASLKDSILHTITTVIRKSVFIEEGGFNPSIPSGQDTDLFIRLGLKYAIVFTPKLGAKYNIFSENNLSKTKHFKIRLQLLKAYENIENEYLQQYINLNRYAIGLGAKLAKNKAFYSAKKDLNFNLLSTKQKILFLLPSRLLKVLKKIQDIMTKKGIYITSI